MYKILEKKTFDQLPEKQKLIEIEFGCKDMQTLFQEEESHKGLKWQDYQPETKQHLKEKYDGKGGKESFYYKINETDYVKRFNRHIDRVFWKEGDNLDWEFDFLTRAEQEIYAETN